MVPFWKQRQTDRFVLIYLSIDLAWTKLANLPYSLLPFQLFQFVGSLFITLLNHQVKNNIMLMIERLITKCLLCLTRPKRILTFSRISFLVVTQLGDMEQLWVASISQSFSCKYSLKWAGHIYADDQYFIRKSIVYYGSFWIARFLQSSFLSAMWGSEVGNFPTSSIST